MVKIKKLFLLALLIFGIYVVGSTPFTISKDSKTSDKAEHQITISEGIYVQASDDLGYGVDIPETPKSSVTDFDTYIKAILKFANTAGVALATLMLIYAGYKYMTSQGNPTAINEAKDIIIGSLSGLALLLLTSLILNVLNITN